MDITEGCYVYTSKRAADTEAGAKKKRRKTKQTQPETPSALHQHPNHNFVPLFDGKESSEYVALRAETFQSIWAAKAEDLERVLHEANAETVQRITTYISNTIPTDLQSQLPAGLVTSGLATSSSGSMYGPIKREVKEVEACSIICVPAAQCPNLKMALKTIVRNGTEGEGNNFDDEDEDDEVPRKRTTRLLNFDLEALQEHFSSKDIKKCVLFFQNSEALDGNVLGELLDVLSSWQDRIPFIILFEIAVSADLFQEKLSRNTVRLLRGMTFESKSASEILDLMFRSATSPDDSNPLYLGAGTSRLLLDRQEEHIQSAKGFISALKYMYMTHFFNNPLSMLLSPSRPAELQHMHRSAIRRLKSFTHYIEDLSTEDPEEAQKLQHSDTYINEKLPDILATSRTSLLTLLDALEVLHAIHAHSGAKAPLTWSSLYTKALSGNLSGSPLLRELLLAVRKFPSDNMQSLLSSLAAISSLSLGTLPSDLARLIARAQKMGASSKTSSNSHATPSSTPVILRSAYDPAHTSTRTTVISQKISLTQTQSAISALDTDYSRISSRIHSTLRTYFTSSLLAPVEIPLSEVLIFDAKGVVTSALGAAPRAAVERALERHGDYMDCGCMEMGGEDEALTGKEPPTGILWQLVQEAGTIVNVEDLWRAFEAIVGDEEEQRDSGQEDEGNMTLALFYRAMAELRYLGFVKNSRKRADHLMKLRWKGL